MKRLRKTVKIQNLSGMKFIFPVVPDVWQSAPDIRHVQSRDQSSAADNLTRRARRLLTHAIDGTHIA